MRKTQGSGAEDGKMADEQALENEIVVIEQIDQTSRERLGDRGGDSPGVYSSAGT